MHQTQMRYNDVRHLPNALETLESLPETGHGLLSVVLDTSVSRVPGQAYLLFFRDAARDVRSEVEKRSPDELKDFDAAVERVDYFLLHQFSPRNPGLALYASANPEYFLAVPLPDRPAEEVVWDRQPHVAPLIEALDEYERVAVALTDKRQARIFTIFLGAITLEETIESELEGRHDPGDWPRRVRASRTRVGRQTPGKAGTIAWSGMAQARQQRRHLEQARSHARQVAGALMDLLRDKPFDRLFLAGPEEAVSLVEDVLPRPLQARLADSLSIPVHASEAEVLEEALRAAEEIERRGEVAIVQRLLEAIGARTAALGLEPTLRAASDGRVATLVVGPELDADVRACLECGQLTTETPNCPRCGATLVGVDDPRERLITEVLGQGGRIEVVSGEADELLTKHGGVGAFTRY